MHGTQILNEADRLMTVCNSCRYCEGLCAVFPAMEMRRSFSDGDLNYFANLCHACGACYTDCQFSPPHEFNVNVPQTLAIARAESYAAYVWPRVFAGAFARNGLVISLISALSVAAFILGFASTSVATLYHYLLAREAPYAWWDAPVVLGTLGGIGLLIGPIGLLAERWKRDPVLVDQQRMGMDAAFIVILFLTSLTGMALLILRETPAMGPLLALHLGVVFALFLTMPYGKFVHGLYRFVALVRYAREP